MVALLALISSLDNNKAPVELSDKKTTENHEGYHSSSFAPFSPVSGAPKNIDDVTTDLLGALTKQIRHAIPLLSEIIIVDSMQTLEDTFTHQTVTNNLKEVCRLFDGYPSGESFIDDKIEEIWAEVFPIGIELIAMLNQVDKSTTHHNLRNELVLIMTEDAISLITLRLEVLSAALKLYFMIFMQ